MSEDKHDHPHHDLRPDDTRPRGGGIVPAPQAPPGSSGETLGDLEMRPGHRQPKKGGSGGVVAWVLLILMVGAATFLALRYYVPLQEALAEAKTNLASLHKENAALQEQVKSLQSSRTDLAAQVAKREQEVQALQSTQDELAKKLESEISKGDVAIKQFQGQIVVDLVDKILFPPGEAELSDKGKEVLKQVGETFLKVPDKVIQIGGHTDDVPIAPKLKDRFQSNWELSAARALNVVHFLQDDVTVPGERLVASGFSQFRPSASNKTPAGRKKNRRIEVVLLPLTPAAK